MAPVRIASKTDAAAVAAIYAPYVLETAISFETSPPSAAEMAGRISSTLETHPFLVFDPSDGVVGYAYASAHRERAAYRWSVDLAVYVDRQAHRRGVGRALYAHLFELLARQGYHSAFAGIALPNPKSVSLHEAMGFVHLGTYARVGFKHGAWHDVGWWQRTIRSGLPDADPIAFATLRDEQSRSFG
jgi:phosphinothricin acetyltransferase